MRTLAASVITVALVACGGSPPPVAPAPARCPVVATDPVGESPGPSSCDRPDLEKRIAALEAELEQRTHVASETAISLDGNALTVQAPKAGEVRAIDDQAAVAASKQFVAVVSSSRAAIQACYQQALKLNTALASRTVTLSITASFTKTGAHQRSTTAPSLGDTFDDCMKKLMTAWSLPGIASAMTFKAQVTLTP